MGRNRVHPTNGASNPLQKFFGVYLRLRKNELKLTTEYMARSLGVTPTYYRLIEAGQAAVALGRASDLIYVFTPRKVYIDLSSLATLLTGIAIVEKSLVDEINSEDPFRALVDYSDFKELLEETRPYLAFQESGADQQNFLETTAYSAVREFLETSPGQRDRNNPHLSLKGVSAGGVEILKHLHRQLIGRRFVGEKSLK
jgi:transcriptional regulator with XRE-family HTH domain